MSVLTRIPFGKDSSSREQLGLAPRQLELVVAVAAADFTGVGPVSVRDLNDLLGTRGHQYMLALVRAGWLEPAGTVKGTAGKLYTSTKRARVELGLAGWSLLKEVA